MLPKDAKVELLERVPLYDSCSKRDQRAIASIADELDLPAGRELTREGATGREFLVIVSGAAEVRRINRRENILRDGDFLGEIARVTGEPRSATVTTTAWTRLLAIAAHDFRRLLRDSPSIQLKVLEAVARRVPQD